MIIQRLSSIPDTGTPGRVTRRTGNSMRRRRHPLSTTTIRWRAHGRTVRIDPTTLLHTTPLSRGWCRYGVEFGVVAPTCSSPIGRTTEVTRWGAIPGRDAFWSLFPASEAAPATREYHEEDESAYGRTDAYHQGFVIVDPGFDFFAKIRTFTLALCLKLVTNLIAGQGK